MEKRAKQRRKEDEKTACACPAVAENAAGRLSLLCVKQRVDLADRPGDYSSSSPPSVPALAIALSIADMISISVPSV